MTPVEDAAQHVRVAGFWRRALAGAADGCVLLALGVVFNVVTAVALGQPLPRLGQIGPDYLLDVAMGGSLMAQIAATLLAILCFLYFFIFHALRGQTPGKRLLGLQVIDGYGELPSFGRALARTFAYVPSTLLFLLGFLWIGFDREKRALHDWIADTYVIRAEAA